MAFTGRGARVLLVAALVSVGALAGVGAGYALWGSRVASLGAEVEKLEGWIAQEMRGSDERNRAAEARIRELEAQLGKLQGALGEAQADWRAERQRRRILEERLATQELRRGR